VNPYEEYEFREELAGSGRSPTSGEDPYVFDDVGEAIDGLGLPVLEGRPELRF